MHHPAVAARESKGSFTGQWLLESLRTAVKCQCLDLIWHLVFGRVTMCGQMVVF